MSITSELRSIFTSDISKCLTELGLRKRTKFEYIKPISKDVYGAVHFVVTLEHGERIDVDPIVTIRHEQVHLEEAKILGKKLSRRSGRDTYIRSLSQLMPQASRRYSWKIYSAAESSTTASEICGLIERYASPWWDKYSNLSSLIQEWDERKNPHARTLLAVSYWYCERDDLLDELWDLFARSDTYELVKDIEPNRDFKTVYDTLRRRIESNAPRVWS